MKPNATGSAAHTNDKLFYSGGIFVNHRTETEE